MYKTRTFKDPDTLCACGAHSQTYYKLGPHTWRCWVCMPFMCPHCQRVGELTVLGKLRDGSVRKRCACGSDWFFLA